MHRRHSLCHLKAFEKKVFFFAKPAGYLSNSNNTLQGLQRVILTIYQTPRKVIHNQDHREVSLDRGSWRGYKHDQPSILISRGDSMPDPITINSIGIVESPVKDPVDENWGSVTSRISLKPEYSPGLLGLGDFSHVIVVTYLHKASFDPSRHLQRRPRGLAHMPKVGIFSQRAKDRPNPLGVTAVELLAVGENHITVRGLDAIDGTPVIDIKPYYPQYDRIDSAVVPSWVEELMKGYF
jgi:tRNA-Thr(GGU) m(6)t(6)A37 methyltransferase TsaA